MPSDLHLVRTRLADQEDFSGPPVAGVVAYVGAAFTTLADLVYDETDARLVLADQASVGFGTGGGDELRVYSDGTRGIVDLPAPSGRLKLALSTFDVLPPLGFYAPHILLNQGHAVLEGVGAIEHTLYVVGTSTARPSVVLADKASSVNAVSLEYNPATTTTTFAIGNGTLNIQGSGVGKIRLGDANDQLGLFGATPVGKRPAYTQTYAATTRTHADPAGSTVTATATDSSPWGYASEAEAADVVTQLNNVIDDLTNLKQLVNAVIDDLQSLGAVG